MNYNTSKLFDELLDAWNRHDVQKAVSYYHEDIVWRDYSMPESFEGIDGATQVYKMWVTAFPDLQIRVLNKLVGDDIVAVQFEFTGTHTGPLNGPDMNVPPTNRKVTVSDAAFCKFRNGKLIEVHDYPDVQGFMTQLGLHQPQAEQQTF